MLPIIRRSHARRLIGVPITTNIVQIMEYTINAKVIMNTTDQALYLRCP